jgi:hypothetical protein
MDATEAWTEFLQGNAKASSEPFSNPYAEAARDMMRAWGVRADWIRLDHGVRSRAYPAEKRIEAPFPVDAMSFAVVAHELMHVAHEPEWRDLPDWVVELRASERVLDIAEARELPQVDAMEYKLGRHLVTTYLRNALDRGIATREQIIEETSRPGLIRWYGSEWLGIRALTTETRADVDEFWGPLV